MATTLQSLSSEALARDTDRQAVEFDGAWHSWGDLRRIADAVSHALNASGLGQDAPVAFIPRNHPAALAAMLALIAQGRTIRMIYAFQSSAGIARDVRRLKAAAVIAAAGDFAPEVREALAETGAVGVELDGMSAAALPGFETTDSQTAKDSAIEPCIEILTSGTTGPPKPFAIAYKLLEQHFLSTPLTRQQGGDAATATPFLLYFPLGNISGIYSTLPMLLRGQRIILLDRFTVAAWHHYVREYRPTHSGLPPSFVGQVLDANIPKEDLASLKALGVGAAPLDPETQTAFEDHYGIPILVSYGATEFAGPVAMVTADLHQQWGREKLGSVGRAMPGVQLRVVDADTGDALPAGEEGLLHVVSPRIGTDWIQTSDIAVIDADGFLFLKGRADGAIMRGGFKVLPETIERALMLHPDIAEAVVTGMADPRLGQVPAAAIRLRTAAKEPAISEIESHLRQHVLATHIPAKWLFCQDIPRTPSLKPDRTKLREMFKITIDYHQDVK